MGALQPTLARWCSLGCDTLSPMGYATGLGKSNLMSTQVIIFKLLMNCIMVLQAIGPFHA
jgi:hypothetical protein